MSKNQLASYFKDTNDESMITGGSGGSGALSDLTGRSFFDLISECKDFSRIFNHFYLFIQFNLINEQNIMFPRRKRLDF